MNAPTPPIDDATFARIANRTRDGMAEMVQALAAELDGKVAGAVGAAEASSAIVTGTICQAVELFFGMCVSAGIPFSEGRIEMEKQIDTYWKQAAVRHFTAKGKAAAAEEGR